MKNALLISGGHIDYEFVNNYYHDKSFDMVIAIDGGLKAADELGITPTHIVGDFDTISSAILSKYNNKDDIVIKRLNPEKDFTDTQCAINMANESGCNDLVIIGGTGTRLDHTIANIHTLQLALNHNINAVIINENNRISLVDNSLSISQKDVYGTYVSFLPLTQNVTITLEGFKYPLNNYDMDVTKTMSLGVSNEVTSDVAKVNVSKGIAIMIESRD